jgi:HAD superfamily hydrolase (TIGR01490 family)
MTGADNGPTIVFLDMDHTVMDNDCDVSWKSFLIEEGLADPSEREEAAAFFQQYREGRLDVDAFVIFQLRQFRGRTPAEMAPLTQRHFERHALPNLFPEAVRTVERCRERGVPTVLLTATCGEIAGPLAARLGVEAMRATRLEVADGRYTGRIVPPYCFGAGKLIYAREECERRSLRLAQAGYYGDSAADIPLLEAVGFPVAVNPAAELDALARERGWPIARWQTERARDGR